MIYTFCYDDDDDDDDDNDDVCLLVFYNASFLIAISLSSFNTYVIKNYTN
jgi:hypothetical protein